MIYRFFKIMNSESVLTEFLSGSRSSVCHDSWLTPVILALRRRGREENQEFKVSLTDLISEKKKLGLARWCSTCHTSLTVQV